MVKSRPAGASKEESLATQTKLGSGVIRIACESAKEQKAEVRKLTKKGGKASTSPSFFLSQREPTVFVRMPDGQGYSVEDWSP